MSRPLYEHRNRNQAGEEAPHSPRIAATRGPHGTGYQAAVSTTAATMQAQANSTNLLARSTERAASTPMSSMSGAFRREKYLGLLTTSRILQQRASSGPELLRPRGVGAWPQRRRAFVVGSFAHPDLYGAAVTRDLGG